MPTYEYACKECEEHLEVHQSFTDSALTECPKCGGRLRKVFGNIGITFKGSGFYKTDSRAASKTGGKSADKNGDSSKSTDTKTDTKADSKPDSKGETKTESKSETKGESKPKADTKVAATG